MAKVHSCLGAVIEAEHRDDRVSQRSRHHDRPNMTAISAAGVVEPLQLDTKGAADRGSGSAQAKSPARCVALDDLEAMLGRESFDGIEVCRVRAARLGELASREHG
jgi:hypothetical protein